MKENTLLKIALICSLAGLLVLYFISAKINAKDYVPSPLNKNIGDDVRLQGIVTKVNDKGNVVFVELSQQVPVAVVLFANNQNVNLKNNDHVEVIGKVQEYNGKNEIVADKIRVIK